MTYRNIAENKDVVDALSCIIIGYDTVKKMIKKLKQPQSTLSMKLMALKKSDLVKKNRWKYDVNWKELIKMMRTIIDDFIGNKARKYARLFTDRRLEKIMTAYAEMLDIFNFEQPTSIRNMMWNYLLGLGQTSDAELRSTDKDFVGLKKELNSMSKEKFLFMTSEKENVEGLVMRDDMKKGANKKRR